MRFQERSSFRDLLFASERIMMSAAKASQRGSREIHLRRCSGFAAADAGTPMLYKALREESIPDTLRRICVVSLRIQFLGVWRRVESLLVWRYLRNTQLQWSR